MGGLGQDAGVPSGIRVEHVGAQTGMGVDDVGIITDQGGFVLLGAKKNLGLDEPSGSPLAKALDQVVEQYVGGVPDGSGALRPLDPERDLLVMTTDSSAPASVRVGLAKLISNLAGEPGYLDLPNAVHDDQQKEALPVLRGHLLRSRHWSAPPTEDDIRALFRVLRLQVLGLEPDGEQRAVAEVRLTQVLADRSQQGDAFEALTRMAGMLGERRWWMSRRDILAWLRDNGFPLLGDLASTLTCGSSPVGPQVAHHADAPASGGHAATARRRTAWPASSMRSYFGVPSRSAHFGP